MESDLRILDGAMGTELERRGASVPLPLWTTNAIDHHASLIRSLHREYLEAGADIVTACTFRTNRRALDRVGRGDEAMALTARAVELARDARDACNTDAIVAGSLAPLEDCYEPDIVPSPDIAEQEHAEGARNLIEAGVDVILIETMNARREMLAALRAVRSVAPDRFMLSFTPKPGGAPGVLRRGGSIVDIIPEFADAQAVGVNCVSPVDVGANVRLLRHLLPKSVAVMAYANTGVPREDGSWDATAAVSPETYAVFARDWVNTGASIIGGCCGTTPETIRQLAAMRSST